jgi:hypothetical protein
VYWIQQAEGRRESQDVVNMVINLEVTYKWEIIFNKDPAPWKSLLQFYILDVG